MGPVPRVRISPRRLTATWLGLLLLSAAAAMTACMSPAPASAAPSLTEGWTQVVSGGFDDPNNSIAPSWAEFQDYLYVSTMANESGSVFSGSSKAGGDIWRSADGVQWEQIGTAGLGNPHNSWFQLVVFRDKLYAISTNLSDHGIEVWVTSDGTRFTKIESGGFGDKDNDSAFAQVFADRLILAVSNVESGAEIWVSDDGQSFRQVVDGGMGDPGVTGFVSSADPESLDPVMQGKLYLGVSNPGNGGEIWRTADGLEWERVADKGLTSNAIAVLDPEIVYEDHLYAFGTARATLENIPGFDLFRTSDGTTWEQVVENGFSVGEERNVHGGLQEFKGRLYLTCNTMDPRLLMPSNPSERLAPRGFQLRVSDDGKTWEQIGEDGFGVASSIMAGMEVRGDTAYLTVFDYHEGSRLLRSTDGQSWETIFREPDPDLFDEGGGWLELKGHLLWVNSNLQNGIEIWRSDAVMVVEPPTPGGEPKRSARFVSSVPLPTEISRDPGVIGTNVVLALLFAAIFGLTSSLFNNTIQAHNAEIARALGPLTRWAKGGADTIGRLGSRPWSRRLRRLAPVALVVVAGLIYALLDPGFGFSIYGLTIFISLALSVAIVTYAYGGVQAITSSRRYGVPAAVKLFPIAIGIALVCVLLSRLTGFLPGYLYGFVGGLAFLGAREPDARKKARLVLVASGCLLAVSLVAWFLAVPVTNAVESGSSWLKVLQGICVSTFVAGLEGLFFGLIPLSVTDGGTLFRRSKLLWAGAFAVATFLFWHVLLNKDSKYGAAFTESSAKVVVAMLIFWTLVTVGVYWYFRKPRGKAAARLGGGAVREGGGAVREGGGPAMAGTTAGGRAFCRDCGAALSPGARYCSGCGRRL